MRGREQQGGQGVKGVEQWKFDGCCGEKEEDGKPPSPSLYMLSFQSEHAACMQSMEENNWVTFKQVYKLELWIFSSLQSSSNCMILLKVSWSLHCGTLLNHLEVAPFFIYPSKIISLRVDAHNSGERLPS